MSIHDRIKKRRIDLGLNQAELARRVAKILEAPVSYQLVQQWESGIGPGRKRRPAVAKALEMTEHDLELGPIEPAKPDLRSTAVNNDTYIELGRHWSALSPLFQQALLAIAKEAARNVNQAATTAVGKARKQPGLPTRQKGKKTTA